MSLIKKKMLSMGLVFMILVSLVNVTECPREAYAANKLVVISTAEAFQAFIAGVHGGDTYAGKTVILDQNIVFDHTAVNLDCSVTGVFDGTFDGRGHSVTGIRVEGNEKACLFNIGTNGDVRNLLIAASYFTGTDNATALADVNDGVIQNCFVYRTNILAGRKAAGLVIENNGIIRNSANLDSTLKIEAPKDQFQDGCGGIAVNNMGKIMNSCNTSSIEIGGGISSIGGVVAFMLGSDETLLSTCYNTGMIHTQSTAGGVIGRFRNGTAVSCYSANEACDRIVGDYSMVSIDDCLMLGHIEMLKPDFATLLNSKLANSGSELSAWNVSPDFGCVIPAFPGVFAETPAPGTALPAPKAVKAKNTAKRTISVTWKKVMDADGYSVEISSKKNFKKAKAYTTAKTKCVIKKLKKGKVFVRVRAFVSDDDGPEYGAYSRKVKVTVKK